MSAAPDIFLSYNREDAAVAKLYAAAFAGAGLEVWWDATLKSGEAYDEVTEAALNGAKAVVVLWSPRSVSSRWVRAEATVADQNGTLMPVTIEACRRPVMFELTQTADLSHWRGEAQDKAWLAFLGDVSRMVGRQGVEVAEAAAVAGKSTAGGGMPIVAVLPVQSRGGGEAEFLAEDLTEDFTRELSQSFYCKVIAASTMAAWRSRAADHRALQRELDARYAIESRLQCSGGNLRLTMQLIDTESGSALWSSRFVSQLSEIEDSPDQFALSIAIELDQTIGNIECARALAKRPPCTAWEYVLRAVTTMSHHSPGDAQREVDEARRAVAAAPDYGLAHATLARTLSSSLLTNRLIVGDAERRSMIRESHDAVKRAIELDSNSAFVLTILANAYAQLGDAEAGLRLAHRATMLAPNSAEAHFALGFCNFMLGRSAETIEAFGNQDRIGLSDNARMAGQSLLGICLFIEGKSAEAEAAIDSSLTLQPTSYLAIRWKAIVAAELGKDESARAAIRRLRESEPGKSIEEYLDSPRHLPIEHPRKYEAIEILRKLLEETAGC